MKTKAILTLVVTWPVAVLAENWPQYRGQTFDGTTQESLNTTKFTGQPKEAWRVPSPTGFSSFVTGNGHVYTIVKREQEGIPKETLLALDHQTGTETWATPLGIAKFDGGGDSGAGDNKGGDGPRSTPAFDSGKVYAIDGGVIAWCLNAKDGSVVWKREILKEHGGKAIRWQNAASPVLDGDLLFLAGGGAGQAFLALNKATGQVAWKTGDDAMTHATPVVATIHGVRQVIFFSQKGLRSFETKGGQELWHFPYDFKTSTAASPVVYQDIIFCSAGYGVGGGACKIAKEGDKFTAALLWRAPNKVVNHWSTPVCRDGYLYGLFGFKEYGGGPLACYDIRTGEKKWEEPGFGPGHLILAGDKLLVLGDAGQLVVAEAKPTGYKELAKADVLEGKCWSTPILANGRVYLRSTKEAVCLDLSK